MVSEPLLWPFLSSIVFIGATPFSTSLLPSQQSSQPFAIEPPTSSSCCLWVPDLQSLSLRSPTSHRPLHVSSLPWILLWLHFCRYHWDRLAPIYTLVVALQPSDTARAAQRFYVKAHAPHVLSSAPSWCHPWRHQCHVSPSLCQHPLTLIVDFFSRVDFCSPSSPYPIFRIDFIFAIYFCIFCFQMKNKEKSSCCNKDRKSVV